MKGEVARWAALSAAFWLALLLPLRTPTAQRSASRLLAGLVLGAAAAHAGWLLLHARSDLDLALLIDPTRGQTLLFAPLGLLAVAPRGAGRAAFLDAALGSQPAAWAAAKLGCVLAGCCGGAEHPVALYETAAYLAASVVVPRSAAPATFALVSLATIRLASQPLREATLPAPVLDPAWLCLGLLGLAAWVATLRRGEGSLAC